MPRVRPIKSILVEPMNTIVRTTIEKDLANQIDPVLKDNREQMLFHLYMGNPPAKWKEERPGIRRPEWREPGVFEPLKAAAPQRTLSGPSVDAPIVVSPAGEAAVAEIVTLNQRPPSHGGSGSRSMGSRHSGSQPSLSRMSTPSSQAATKERPPGGTMSEWNEHEKNFPVKRFR
mmetsp:Transcript_82272/g.209094  ORF Transcript_82272/g.209094 Transcript_82272/m.209094 type:complete len:174 (-) Transcript_82272:44-565(-)